MPRHGVGVSLYMTDHPDKQVKKKKQQQQQQQQQQYTHTNNNKTWGQRGLFEPP